MPNCTQPPPPSQEHPPLLVSDRYALSQYIHCCEHAQTVTAWSEALALPVLIPLGCRQWSCRFCAETKIRQLSAKTRDAKPTRLLTLTIDPSLYHTPREAFDATRGQVSELVKKIRSKFGECEYLRVTELTKAGWPHYHLLVRSNFLPHAWVRDRWQELTGARIVDLRQVKATFRAYNYLVKYLSKLHKIEWTERHVSYSQNFFQDDYKPKGGQLNLTDKTVWYAHPVTVLLENYERGTVQRLDTNLYRVEEDPFPEGT